MPLIFSALCEPPYSCVSQSTEKKVVRQKSRRTGIRMAKEQEKENNSFSKRRKRGRREGMAHTKEKKTNETEWARNRTAESGLYEWNRRIKRVSSFQEWMFNTCTSAACTALLQPRRHLVSVTSSEEPHSQPPPLKYSQHIPCTHRSSPWSQ